MTGFSAITAAFAAAVSALQDDMRIEARASDHR